MAEFTLEDGSTITAFTEDEMKAKIDEEVGGLKTKVDELLGEKKNASQRAKELEEQQAAAEEERMKEKQQFKELYEKEQKSKQELQEKYEEFQGRIKENEINAHATKIAGKLTKDTDRAELLSEKASAFAKYTENGVKFELGGVEVDSEKIQEHLKEKYPFLVDGSGAQGGGASGGVKGGGAAKGKRSEMSAKEKAAYVQEHGQEAYLKLPK